MTDMRFSSSWYLNGMTNRRIASRQRHDHGPPFDLSGSKIQASIKKVPSAAAYRCFIPASSEAQDLGVARAPTLGAAATMGAAGLPNAEHHRARHSFPCDYCEWKTRCQVVDKG